MLLDTWICHIQLDKTFLGKLQITPLKFGVDWILHPKISKT